MIASQVGAALKARLAALTFNPVIPVAWPNKDFTPTGERFLSAAIVRAPNQRLTITAEHRMSGSLVVTVCSKAGVGSGEGDGIADAVGAWFPADMVLTLSNGSRLRITAAPSVRDGFLDAGYWRTPVIVPFEAMQ